MEIWWLLLEFWYSHKYDSEVEIHFYTLHMKEGVRFSIITTPSISRFVKKIFWIFFSLNPIVQIPIWNSAHFAEGHDGHCQECIPQDLHSDNMKNECEIQPSAFTVTLFISWIENCWEALGELLSWDNRTRCCVSLINYFSFFDI